MRSESSYRSGMERPRIDILEKRSSPAQIFPVTHPAGK